jgi:RES domain-containing protein
VVFQLDVDVPGVVDLTAGVALDAVGLTMGDVAADDHRPCQRVGGAAAWLGRCGLLVPSARAAGGNLVIFFDAIDAAADIHVRTHEVIERRSD